MKRFLSLFSVLLVLTACGPKEPVAETDAVSAFLDSGGVQYQVVDGQYEWEAIRPTVDLVLGIFAQILRTEEEVPPEVITWVESLPQTLGMDEVVRRGSSTLLQEDGIYITKTAMERTADASGTLWQLSGNSFDLRQEINRLPEQTALMLRFSLNAPWIMESAKETTSSLVPETKEGIQMAESQLAMSGFPLDAVLQALKGGVTFAICLNPEVEWPIPAPGGMQIPQIGLVLIVEDPSQNLHSTLMQLIQAEVPPQMQPIARTTQDVTVHRFLGLPIPVKLIPQLAHANGRLILTTDDLWMDQILTRASGELDSPLLATLNGIEEAQAEMAWVISDSMIDFLETVGTKVMEVAEEEEEDLPADLMNSYISTFLGSIPHVGLCHQGETLTTSIMLHREPMLPQSSTAGAQSIMTVPAVVGLGTAIAIPSFRKARENAQDMVCLNNLRQLEAASQIWAIENNILSSTPVSMQNIKEYLDGELTCPEGGIYIIGTVEEPPSCTVHGNPLRY